MRWKCKCNLLLKWLQSKYMKDIHTKEKQKNVERLLTIRCDRNLNTLNSLALRSTKRFH